MPYTMKTDQLIEVAAHFRIVASLAYLPVNSSVKRNQECLLRSRQIAKALVELRTSSTLLRCSRVTGYSGVIRE
jgi:hypothetical protein